MNNIALELSPAANHYPLPNAHSTVRDWFTLLKPGVMSLVVFTGAAGMLVAPGHLHPFLQFITLLCIALASGAGAALNMWYDRDIDAIMKRTQNRPIPAGRIQPDDALMFGLFLSGISVALLGLAVGWLAASILAFAIFFYAIVYTQWLKRSTPQNIVIGGAAGAFPPMIGWVAVSGSVGIEALLLFLIIFLWTPPHFWALALYRNEDYKRANIPMLPVTHGASYTKWHMLAYTISLIICTLALPYYNMGGWLYISVAAGLGLGFIWHSLRVLRSENPKHAMAMFGYSIIYLFVLYAALVIDHWFIN